MANIYICTGNDLKASVRRLYDKGDITLDQYAQCLRRWQESSINTQQSNDNYINNGLEGLDKQPLRTESHQFSSSVVDNIMPSSPFSYLCTEWSIDYVY